jgi:hypothetical protein
MVRSGKAALSRLKASRMATEQGALALDATRFDGEGENWRVYADPAGKPFCLLWNAD